LSAGSSIVCAGRFILAVEKHVAADVTSFAGCGRGNTKLHSKVFIDSLKPHFLDKKTLKALSLYNRTISHLL
jgi:hypothetical protein